MFFSFFFSLSRLLVLAWVQSLVSDPNFFPIPLFLFFPSFPPLFHLFFPPPFLSSSNFFRPFSPAFLPFFFLLFFPIPFLSFSHSCFLFLPLSAAFSLSSLSVILMISPSFPPPLSFYLFMFLFFLSRP